MKPGHVAEVLYDRVCRAGISAELSQESLPARLDGNGPTIA